MLCGNYILSNRSEWTFYFLSSVQFNFTIGENNLFINNRIKIVKHFRTHSKKDITKNLANVPWRFAETRFANFAENNQSTFTIIVPRHT